MSVSAQNVNCITSYSEITLSIVLSFYNEEEVLPELIGRLRNVLKTECQKKTIGNYELIFVNDASTDRSKEILKKAAEGYNDIKILNMSRNFGVSPCVLAGMEYSSGDIVAYMDADLQDPPEVIPELLHAWKHEHVDVVHTVRVSRSGESRIKLWITKLGYHILRAVATIELQIEAGDFKLLSRRVVNHLIQLREKKPFIRGLVCWIGFSQTSIRYHRDARFSGKTKFPILSKKVIRNFLDSALISFSDVPLQFSLLAGFIISLGTFLYLLYLIIKWGQGDVLPAWSGIMIAVLLLGSVQLLTIGILGLYINSIYLETKRRPNYIVESTFGFDKSASDDLQSSNTSTQQDGD